MIRPREGGLTNSNHSLIYTVGGGGGGYGASSVRVGSVIIKNLLCISDSWKKSILLSASVVVQNLFLPTSGL